MDLKYDRQIRLFGKDVQNILGRLRISVLSNTTGYISGEILKNIVLLGVNEIYADTSTLHSFNKLVPNTIKGINPRCKLLEECPEVSDMVFVVSKCSDPLFVCSDPLFVSTNPLFVCKDPLFVCKDHYEYKKGWGTCKGKKMSNDKVKDCLIGGIIVQEFIKKLQNQKYEEEFSLNNLL
jgi:hypothetical protein